LLFPSRLIRRTMARGAPQSVRAHAAARLAWSTWGLTLAVQGLGLLFWGIGAFFPLTGGDSAGSGGIVRVGLLLTFGVVATVGAFIGARQPRNPIGWMMLVGALVASFEVFASNYAAYAQSGSVPASPFVAWLGPVLNVSVALVPPLLLLFPDGRLPSRRWKPVVWLSAASVVLLVATKALDPGRLQFATGEPLVATQAILPALDRASQGALVLAIVLATASLVLRMRHARGDQRLQLRWIAFAAVVWAAGLAASILTPAAWQPVVRIAYLITLNGFVVAVCVAVLKYRLYDIDVVINKTIVYGALALMITGVYVGLVLGVGTVVGASGGSDLWLALLATVVVALRVRRARHAI
jgi:hypothetical protein